MIKREEWVVMRNLAECGLSKTEMARRLGVTRKTVGKILKKSESPKYKRIKLSPTKLDPYKEHINLRLEKYNLSSEKLYEEILKQGYSGKYGIVNLYARGVKKNNKTRAIIRFETLPGEQAQVDWAFCGMIYDSEKKKRTKVYCFVMVLGFSRMKYIEFFESCIFENFLKGHNNAFKYFGGYTKEILYDNLKSVVLKRAIRAEDSEFNKKFVDFAGYYGFKPILARPYKPNTKGKVENTVDYVKDNFLNGEEFTFQEINTQRILWLNKVHNLVHCTTKEKPIERFKKENLISIENKNLYDTSTVSYRKIFSDSHFCFKANRYSVPYKYAGKEIGIKENDSTIKVLYQNEEIAEHIVNTTDKGIYITNKEHLKGLEELRRSHGILRPKSNKQNKKINETKIVILYSPILNVEKRDLRVYEEATCH